MPCFESQRASHAFIGLGSNLEDPACQILRALDALAALSSSRLLAHSSLYRTAPIGNHDQPEFVNAVAHIETGLAPRDLLAALLDIELAHGRTRTCENGPRTLDLDILLYDELQYSGPQLTLPHPRMHQRAFVLRPLLEIATHCSIPGRGAVAELLVQCAGQKIEKEQ
jgi:2-amino-4-hydroxy-6-hydroxymethyldihydropteridine diphosphokinase